MSTTADGAPRIPWLAQDRWRNHVAFAGSAVVTAAVCTTYLSIVRPGFSANIVVDVAFVFWSVYALGYLVLTLGTFTRLDAATFRAWLLGSEPRSSRPRRIPSSAYTVQWAVLAVISVATISVLPVLTDSVFSNALSFAVVGSAWAVTIVAFAIHYARESVTRGGLDFPGEKAAVFSDFVYLSAQLSTTFSSSDVNITTARARRIVTTHALVAFCFSTVVIALLLALIFFTD